MAEKTKRVPASEYPGADQAVWADYYDGGRLRTLLELGDGPMVAARFRAPTASDVPFDPYDVYSDLADSINDDEESPLVGEDGGPFMLDWRDLTEQARDAWTAALREIIASAIDLSDSLHVATGERVRLHGDGTVERIDAGGEP